MLHQMLNHGDTMTTTANQPPSDQTSRQPSPRERGRFGRSALNTMPIVLAGSLVLSMNLTGPLNLEPEKRAERERSTTPDLRDNVRQAFAAAGSAAQRASVAPAEASVAAAPASYTVAPGDTISGIAGRYGLSTASVLALNGLGWKSVIYPGQMLVLSKSSTPIVAAPAPAAPAPSSGQYTIVRGDTIGAIAHRFGMSTPAVLAANGLSRTSIIYPGQTIKLPATAGTAAVTIAPSPTPPPAPTAVAASSAKSHVIAPGETATSIAAKFGVSLSQLLSANTLRPTSIIFAGKTLIIPTPQAATVAIPTSPNMVVPMTSEMRSNAATIVAVGRSLGVNEYGIVIALATAAQESTLRNLNWGDLDSVGLFQQRPSAGWGSVAQLTTPAHSAHLFYGGAKNPNKGKTRGLLDIAGWQNMSVTQAAQAVQISAYPDAYAKWEASARSWLAQIG